MKFTHYRVGLSTDAGTFADVAVPAYTPIGAVIVTLASTCQRISDSETISLGCGRYVIDVEPAKAPATYPE